MINIRILTTGVSKGNLGQELRAEKQTRYSAALPRKWPQLELFQSLM